MAITRGKFKYQMLQFYFLFPSYFKILLIDKIYNVNIGFELHQILCGMRWSKNKYFHFKSIPPIHFITVLQIWPSKPVNLWQDVGSRKPCHPNRTSSDSLSSYFLMLEGCEESRKWDIRCGGRGCGVWGIDKKKKNPMTVEQSLSARRCVFMCVI